MPLHRQMTFIHRILYKIGRGWACRAKPGGAASDMSPDRRRFLPHSAAGSPCGRCGCCGSSLGKSPEKAVLLRGCGTGCVSGGRQPMPLANSLTITCRHRPRSRG
jgi:hypothetical protein